jgi:hypothetical protein
MTRVEEETKITNSLVFGSQTSTLLLRQIQISFYLK